MISVPTIEFHAGSNNEKNMAGPYAIPLIFKDGKESRITTLYARDLLPPEVQLAIKIGCEMANVVASYVKSKEAK